MVMARCVQFLPGTPYTVDKQTSEIMMRRMKLSMRFLSFVLLLAATFAGFAEKPKEFLVYFGTFQKTGSKGIYVSRLDLASGRLTEAEVAVEAKNPGFVAIHPEKKFLYSVGAPETPNPEGLGVVKAFAIDRATGKLKFINEESSAGKGPAHLSVDKSGQCVMVANYGSGDAAVLKINKDGSLTKPTSVVKHTGSSVNPNRQKEPHAHAINPDPQNKYAFIADLGIDKLMAYKLDPAKGTLEANDPAFAPLKPGAGPRHFTFHPNGKFTYVINEMDCTVTAFSYDAQKGAFAEVQSISTLPEGQAVEQGMSTAEVVAHPSGKFLYGSNRGHNTIVVFKVDEQTGKLTSVEHESTQGKIPRNFNVDPTGQFLLAANQDSDSVVVFRINQTTGALDATGQTITVPMPVCVRFLEVEEQTPDVARWPDDAEFPGVGPIQKAPWFQSLWTNRRLDWWKNRENDKGAVVFLGDSITQGWGTLAKDFPTIKVANRGISGDTSRGVLQRLKEDVLDIEPAAVVLLIGTNDIGLNGTPEEVAENTRLILQAIKSRYPRIPVIVCRVMPSTEKLARPADKIQKLNALVDEIVKQDPQFVRCDTWSIFADGTGSAKKEEFPDLLHPNEAGYAKWTAALKPIFEKLE
jgi:6-phosphogluconolactonase